MQIHVGIGRAAKIVGVCVKTLRVWHREGRLVPDFRTPGGHRRYGMDLLCAFCGTSVATTGSKKTIAYARVSSHDQKADLDRQCERLERECAERGWNDAEIVRDLGSGLNFAKKGLRRLLRLIARREIGRLVVLRRDRLVRFGAEMILDLCRTFGIEVIVIEPETDGTTESSLAADVIELMTVFCARMHGRRGGRNTKAKEIAIDTAEVAA